jgi:molybdate transport system substrate-binding protein
MKTRSVAALIAFSAALAGLYAQQAANPNAVRVIASNGIKGVLDEARPKAEAAAGKPLAVDYNSSSAQVDRIEKGADFDVAVLTSDTIDDLVNKGKIVGGSRTLVARAGIGVGIRKGAAVPDVSSGEAIKKALLAAKAVTYAQDGASRVHVEKMFGRLGIMQEMMPKIHLEQGSTKAAAMVAAGHADMILTLISEILPAEGVSLVGPLPAEYQHYVEFAAGTSVKAKHADAGKAMIQFLVSPAVGATLAGKGMEPPGK